MVSFTFSTDGLILNSSTDSLNIVVDNGIFDIKTNTENLNINSGTIVLDSTRVDISLPLYLSSSLDAVTF